VDLFDRATEAEERHRDEALRNQAEKTAAPAGSWEIASAKWCRDATCGQRIPDERRRAIPGVVFCVECTERHETKERRGR
jgi:phage/conjugal plasmid C-4 type zinc finger TraR family protein